jgi:hypothetical protein
VKEKKLRWVKARLTSGEFKGPFWGAHLGGAFLMIVPEKCASGTQYAVWCADTVFGEKPTFVEAKAFAEAMLRGHADRIGMALCRLRLLDRAKKEAA